MRRFILQSVPAALYRIRWWTCGVMVVEIALALVVGMWTLRSPEAMAALGSPEKLDAYAHEAFESYYSTYSAPDFAAAVWTNNARIAAICVAGGITGFLPLYMLYQNAVSVGQSGAILADHDMLGVFLSLISPHGLLELTCIFIAGAAGLKIFWTMLVPGPRSRSAALATPTPSSWAAPPSPQDPRVTSRRMRPATSSPRPAEPGVVAVRLIDAPPP